MVSDGSRVPRGAPCPGSSEAGQPRAAWVGHEVAERPLVCPAQGSGAVQKVDICCARANPSQPFSRKMLVPKGSSAEDVGELPCAGAGCRDRPSVQEVWKGWAALSTALRVPLLAQTWG